ncbi:DUF6068 family protein [Hyalangium versicolor]|uniref:DUF6068 family protein n=1 Tax=Hyalangium versicolor TaxID=2861190 RepID=UPI001CCCB0C5|nr:DUF6068 family protein [Hyalangium versicolor]
MNLRTAVFSMVGSAALALGAGCATTQQQTVPDTSTAPPPPSQESPATATPQPEPSTGSSAWQRARVGDRVVYAFSANRAYPNTKKATAIAGKLALEVVAVQRPWVWLKLSVADEAGKPFSRPQLARELLFPMSMEGNRSLREPPRGTAASEQISAVGRTWDALRFVQDNRPSDGPLEDRLYAASPEALYLTNGLLSSSTTLSGFGASGGAQLTLVELRQGTEGSTAAPPEMKYPLGPGTWSDTSVDSGQGAQVQRDCYAAERGYFLSSSGPVPATNNEGPCPSFAGAAPIPIEEELLNSLSLLLPPAPGAEARGPVKARNTLSVSGRGIPSLTYERPENAGGNPQIFSETLPEDPWHPSLDGLNQVARFNPLAESVDSVGANGKRTTTFTKKLIGWGTWVGGAK